jgi:hypothetical protein
MAFKESLCRLGITFGYLLCPVTHCKTTLLAALVLFSLPMMAQE